MISKTLLVVVVVNLILDYSYGQGDKKFFRKDYKYLEELEGFYKFHTLHKTLFEAKRVCELEGAQLFYPENEKEAKVVLKFWTDAQPYRWLLMGISDLIAKGIFETIDGKPLSDVYDNWAIMQPDNLGGKEDCVIMRRDGTLNDVECEGYPFVCKKSLRTLKWNQQCNMPEPNYIFIKELDRCYKFHMTPLNWTEAYAVCSAEQSYLVVINSQIEADYLVGMAETTPIKKVTGIVKISYLPRAIHSGFRYIAHEGWRTIRGTSLEESGYENWDDKQPNGGDLEQCGSLSYKGKLNDISCETRSFFICEHEV